MAKDNDVNGDVLDDDEEGGKLAGIIAATVIILIWLAIFVLLIKLDVGGFGSSVLRPILKNVPVLNWILPEVSDEEAQQETGYKYKSLADAIARIQELESENAMLQENIKNLEGQISDLTAEVSRLKVFEEYQKNYEALKKKFDTEVVFNSKAPDIKEYKEWYEKLDKANAAEIYRQVLEKYQVDERIKSWAEAYTKMDPAKAAAVLQEMTPDTDKVAKILLNMDSKYRAAILDAMDPLFAAKLTVITYPAAS